MTTSLPEQSRTPWVCPLICIFHGYLVLPQSSSPSSLVGMEVWYPFLWLRPLFPPVSTYTYTTAYNSFTFSVALSCQFSFLLCTIFSLSLGFRSSHKNLPMFKSFLFSEQRQKPSLSLYLPVANVLFLSSHPLLNIFQFTPFSPQSIKPVVLRSSVTSVSL